MDQRVNKNEIGEMYGGEGKPNSRYLLAAISSEIRTGFVALNHTIPPNRNTALNQRTAQKQRIPLTRKTALSQVKAGNAPIRIIRAERSTRESQEKKKKRG